METFFTGVLKTLSTDAFQQTTEGCRQTPFDVNIRWLRWATTKSRDKQQISSKELNENSKDKNDTNSILVTDSATVSKQGHKQQSHDDKQKSSSKQLFKSNKGEGSNTTTNASIEEQL